MIKKAQYDKLNESAATILSTFKTSFLDKSGLDLEDLRDYFDDNNVSIDNSVLYFSIGQNKFMMEPEILYRDDRTNIIIRTLEKVKSVYRTSKLKNDVMRIPDLDLNVYYDFNTSSNEALSIRMKGIESNDLNYLNAVVHQYSLILIKYLENINPEKANVYIG
ncbi:MAG TPA: hypothetical protein VN721_06650 [Flavipsychrobacter sp.]|nr:hypothetical protein [Flavipsychrobacter sp.]